jgi:arylsulfatase A-like enzyme
MAVISDKFTLSWQQHIGIGVLIGLAGGLAEATIVHRAGLPFVPFAVLVYGLRGGGAFIIIALVSMLIRRSILTIGIGAGVAFFSALELAFWANKKSIYPASSPRGMLVSLAVLLVSLGLGVVTYLVIRRRHNKFNPFNHVVTVLVILVALLSYLSTNLYVHSEPGPNCILISIDALRPDHLGCYGYHRETSPNIDALAQRGTRWERAFTQSPGSTGGHASMLTGLYTISHGAYVNGIVLQDPVKTAAEVFAENGYSTAAFANNWFIGPAVGFGQGFDIFVNEGYGLQLGKTCPRLLVRGLVLYQTIHRMLMKIGHPTDLEIKDALQWIRWQRNHKFFIFLHIMDPHSPYIPTDDIRGRFSKDGKYLEPDTIVRLHEESLRRSLSPEESQSLVDRYDEEILVVDSKIGMLVERLSEFGLLDNTMIVVTADHGEVMGEAEGKQFGHGTLDYGTLEIPLIMYLPGRTSRGEAVSKTAQSIDILPTMIDVLGLTDSATRQGTSLVSHEMASLDRRRPAFSTGDIVAKESYTVIAGDWQYTVDGKEISLHRLDVDPYTSTNVIAEYGSIADSLKVMLEEWFERCVAQAAVPYSSEAKAIIPSDDVKQRLKALGYIQ